MTPSSNQAGKGQVIWFDSEALDRFDAEWFSPDYWREQGALTGSADGRGTTHFFQYRSQHYVLRHYRRGGLPGKILSDQYWYAGLSRTRAWRELNLLLQMRELDLPVPRPVAAQVTRHFFYYRSDFVTERIAGARDVHALLQEKPLAEEIWRDIGHTIARFHRYGVYHHDLNIHNIMLDEQHKVWLIDFDKCRIRTGESWKQSNLNRLLRSLHKELGKHDNYHFSDAHWQALMAGYQGFGENE